MVKLICKITALLTLVVLIVPSCMYFADKMCLDTVKNVMLAATVVWFITASIWMWKSESAT
jgi:hypothetical protein